MTNLTEQIEIARANLVRLERMAASASCVELGHDWQMLGGRICNCENGYCSIPVNECKRCGDCDYGDNEEARDIMTKCKELDIENR